LKIVDKIIESIYNKKGVINMIKTIFEVFGSKIIILFFIILFLSIFLQCNTFLHNDDDMEKYVRENISQSSFTILEMELLKTHSDRIDKTKYWKLSFNNKPDYVFYVYSGLVTASGVPQGYYLRTNFDRIFEKYYLDEYKKGNDTKLYTELYIFHDFPFEVYTIKASYSSAEEAHILADDIEKFWNYIRKQPYPSEIYIACEYISPIKFKSERNASSRFDIYSSEIDKMYDPNYKIPFMEINTETIEKGLLDNILQFDKNYKYYNDL
jgi:hypothetical protein